MIGQTNTQVLDALGPKLNAFIPSTKHMKSKFQIFLFTVLGALLLNAEFAHANDYKLDTLQSAHDQFHAATNSTMYAEAAKQYEYLVHEEGIRNGHLFYTLGNSWFMAGDAGRSILNYRRAEQYMPNDTNLRHNLTAALKLQADLIPTKKPHPLTANLLGWHLNTSTTLRWRLFAGLWIMFWGAWFWMSRSTKKEARITVLLTGVFSGVLLASLLTETVMKHRSFAGVIIAPEVLARKGDGTMYTPAFLEPLHSGTEFKQLENRNKWRHIQLADGQTCWIPEDTAETIALD